MNYTLESFLSYINEILSKESIPFELYNDETNLLQIIYRYLYNKRFNLLKNEISYKTVRIPFSEQMFFSKILSIIPSNQEIIQLFQLNNFNPYIYPIDKDLPFRISSLEPKLNELVFETTPKFIYNFNSRSGVIMYLFCVVLSLLKRIEQREITYITDLQYTQEKEQSQLEEKNQKEMQIAALQSSLIDLNEKFLIAVNSGDSTLETISKKYEEEIMRLQQIISNLNSTGVNQITFKKYEEEIIKLQQTILTLNESLQTMPQTLASDPNYLNSIMHNSESAKQINNLKEEICHLNNKLNNVDQYDWDDVMEMEYNTNTQKEQIENTDKTNCCDLMINDERLLDLLAAVVYLQHVTKVKVIDDKMFDDFISLTYKDGKIKMTKNDIIEKYIRNDLNAKVKDIFNQFKSERDYISSVLTNSQSEMSSIVNFVLLKKMNALRNDSKIIKYLASDNLIIFNLFQIHANLTNVRSLVEEIVFSVRESLKKDLPSYDSEILNGILRELNVSQIEQEQNEMEEKKPNRINYVSVDNDLVEIAVITSIFKNAIEDLISKKMNIDYIIASDSPYPAFQMYLKKLLNNMIIISSKIEETFDIINKDIQPLFPSEIKKMAKDIFICINPTDLKFSKNETSKVISILEFMLFLLFNSQKFLVETVTILITTVEDPITNDSTLGTPDQSQSFSLRQLTDFLIRFTQQIYIPNIKDENKLNRAVLQTCKGYKMYINNLNNMADKSKNDKDINMDLLNEIDYLLTEFLISLIRIGITKTYPTFDSLENNGEICTEIIESIRNELTGIFSDRLNKFKVFSQIHQYIMNPNLVTSTDNSSDLLVSRFELNPELLFYVNSLILLSKFSVASNCDLFKFNYKEFKDTTEIILPLESNRWLIEFEKLALNLFSLCKENKIWSEINQSTSIRLSKILSSSFLKKFKKVQNELKRLQLGCSQDNELLEKNRNLEKENRKNQIEISNVRSLSNDLKNQNEQLKKEIEFFKNKLNKCEEETKIQAHAELEKEEFNIMDDEENSLVEVANMNVKNSSAKRRLDDEYIDNTEKEVEKIKKNKQLSVSEEIEQYKEEIRKLKIQHQKAISKLEKKKYKEKSMDGKFSDVVDCSEQEAKILSLQGEINRIIENNSIDKDMKSKLLDATNEAAEMWKVKTLELKNQIIQLVEEIKELKTQIDSCSKHMINYENEIESLSNKNLTLAKENEDREEKLMNVKERHEQEIGELNILINSLQSFKNKENEKEYNNSNLEKINLEFEITSLRMSIENQKLEINNLSKELSKKKSNYNIQKKEFDKIENEYQELINGLNDMRKKFDKQKKEYETKLETFETMKMSQNFELERKNIELIEVKRVLYAKKAEKDLIDKELEEFKNQKKRITTTEIKEISKKMKRDDVLNENKGLIFDDSLMDEEEKDTFQ